MSKTKTTKQKQIADAEAAGAQAARDLMAQHSKSRARKPVTPQVEAPAGSTPLGLPEIPVAAAEATPAADPPAPAPRSPRTSRRRKADATVGFGSGSITEPQETPAWVANAERGPDLAAATTTFDSSPQDAGDEQELTPADAPEITETTMKTTKKTRTPKAAKPAKTDEAPAPKGSLRAAGRDWTTHLEKEGHTPATVATYRRAIATSLGFFGDDATAKDAAQRLDGYAKSKTLTHKENGKPKAKPGIDRDLRAVRMCLEWAGALNVAEKNGSAKPVGKKKK